MSKELLTEFIVESQERAAKFYLFVGLSMFLKDTTLFTKNKNFSFKPTPENSKEFIDKLAKTSSIEDLESLGFEYSEDKWKSFLMIGQIIKKSIDKIAGYAFAFQDVVSSSIFMDMNKIYTCIDTLDSKITSDVINEYKKEPSDVLYEYLNTSKNYEFKKITMSFIDNSEYIAFAHSYAKNDSFGFVSIDDFLDKYEKTSDEFKDKIKIETKKYVTPNTRMERFAELFWV